MFKKFFLLYYVGSIRKNYVIYLGFGKKSLQKLIRIDIFKKKLFRLPCLPMQDVM